MLCIKTYLNEISGIMDEIWAQSQRNSGIVTQFLQNFTICATVQLNFAQKILKNTNVFVMHYNTIVPKITRFERNASVVSTNYSSLNTFFDQISLIFKK